MQRNRSKIPFRHRNGLTSVLLIPALAAIAVLVFSKHQPPPRLERELPHVRNGGGAWHSAGANRGSGSAWRGLRPKANTTAKPTSGTLVDRVTRVRDGDTIVVGLIPVRIANLDCAETGTVAGERATRRIKTLVSGETLTCRLEGRRSYDREVGTCALSDGRDIGQILISQGYCRRWRG